MSKPKLPNLPARYQEQIRAQIGTPPKLRPTIRQRTQGMNKTEARFLEWLRDDNPTASIHHEVALPLANGVRYKVDFLVADPCLQIYKHAHCLVSAYEVKGFARDDAIVKLKVAARVYPWIRFYLVREREGYDGPWQFEEVFA
jgi:hypothetical protein